MDHTKDRILTLREAAERLRISTRTVDRLCSADGGLRKVQISARRIGVMESSIDGYIAARSDQQAA